VQRHRDADGERREREPYQSDDRLALADARCRDHIVHFAIDLVPQLAQPACPLDFVRHELVLQAFGSLRVARAERLEETREVVGVGLQEPLDVRGPLDQVEAQRARPVVARRREAMRHGANLGERLRPHAALGFDPALGVARVLGLGDVVELEAHLVLRVQRSLDGELELHVTRAQKLRFEHRAPLGDHAEERRGGEHGHEDDVRSEDPRGDAATLGHHSAINPSGRLAAW
jgi:hypothetical protein